MLVTTPSQHYLSSDRFNVQRAVEEKLNVLRDFSVVNDENENNYRAELLKAIANRPGQSPQRALDMAAKRMISDYLDEVKRSINEAMDELRKAGVVHALNEDDILTKLNNVVYEHTDCLPSKVLEAEVRKMIFASA